MKKEKVFVKNMEVYPDPPFKQWLTLMDSLKKYSVDNVQIEIVGYEYGGGHLCITIFRDETDKEVEKRKQAELKHKKAMKERKKKEQEDVLKMQKRMYDKLKAKFEGKK